MVKGFLHTTGPYRSGSEVEASVPIHSRGMARNWFVSEEVIGKTLPVRNIKHMPTATS
jgi:hypothetical protein